MTSKPIICPICGYALSCMTTKLVSTGRTKRINNKKYCEFCDKVYKINYNKEIEC
jgi:uncharacterized protein YbaR (Trm112 family)